VRVRELGPQAQKISPRLSQLQSCSIEHGSSDRRRNVRRGDVESAPVISAPASPELEDSLSRGRVRRPDASDPVVVAGSVGQAHAPAGMTVGTPGPGWIRPSPMAPVLIDGIRSLCSVHRASPPIALGAPRHRRLSGCRSVRSAASRPARWTTCPGPADIPRASDRGLDARAGRGSTPRAPATGPARSWKPPGARARPDALENAVWSCHRQSLTVGLHALTVGPCQPSARESVWGKRLAGLRGHGRRF
jgi:hypothetical protein